MMFTTLKKFFENSRIDYLVLTNHTKSYTPNVELVILVIFK